MNQSKPTCDDPRLREAAQEYLAEIEGGNCPFREEFLSRFSDMAEDLLPFLDAIDLFHPLPLEHPWPNPVPDALPHPVGDFRIVRELGKGGMGTVYEAVQLSLGRRVALKVLPSASALNAKQLRRFQNEAEAAAQLHHTNIVPVYGVGRERGVHYYAMQLIHGRNLSEIIHDMRDAQADGKALPTAATPPIATLPTQRSVQSSEYCQSVARLAIHVAEALDHAHHYGIIHRDIKPGNLMLDVDGQIWVTDFGLAQFQQGLGLTRTGDVVGTLRYMSPEQASGQREILDARTDVYSLGATLYELLTLQPMFDDGDRRRLLKQVLEDEPAPPRTWNPSLPSELDTIVLKAVAKIPADRYASAGDLAEDLRRFLEHRPIQARRPTPVQRLKKWGRRHPTLVGAGAFLLVLVSVLSLVSTALVQAERTEKERAYERERLRAEEAERRFLLARRSVDEMIRVSEEELADKPFLDSARRRLLESALIFYQEFIEQRADDPAAQEDLQETKTRVEKILGDLAILEGASQIRLLTKPAILDDLGVGEDQRKRINEMTARIEEDRTDLFKELRGLSAENRRRRLLNVARRAAAQLDDILTSQQRQRLHQIVLQARGPGAFRDPEVVFRLKLTTQQRERVRNIDAETFLGSFERHQLPSDEWRLVHDQRTRAATNRILAALTPEQVQIWHGLSGEPFRGTLPIVPGGGSGPPPR